MILDILSDFDVVDH